MDHKEWLIWRHSGIGGSDAPVIMGVSPYSTPLKLYESKILPEPLENPGNFATERGNRMEVKIRAIVSMEHATEYNVALCQSEKNTWRKVSLDGMSPDKKIILEIKTNDKKSHAETISGKVPEKHYAQLQHALDVSGADFCWYVSYNDPAWDEKKVLLDHMSFLKVERDSEYMANLFQLEEKFWFENVKKKKPPTPIASDYVKLRGLSSKIQKFKRLKLKADKSADELQIVKDELIEVAKEKGHPRCLAGDLKIIQVSRIGSIDYKKVPELKGIDLNKYRKKGSVSWRVQ